MVVFGLGYDAGSKQFGVAFRKPTSQSFVDYYLRLPKILIDRHASLHEAVFCTYPRSVHVCFLVVKNS